ncbi:hypothetical protein FRB90_006814 [Tulasnella sp. 427]|nr:hypothetical protein FRB90_006814 [Tulasnella sp. 427]
MEPPHSLSEVDTFLATCKAVQSAAITIHRRFNSQWNARQPFERLPDEIIHEILQDVLADGTRRPGYTRRPPAYFASQQALRRISSRWNHIILSSAQFWSTLCCTDAPRNRFKMALEKSRNAGLHVICRPSDHCAYFVDRMLEESHRWVSLDILYSEPWKAGLSMDHPMPRLSLIRINARDETLSGFPAEHSLAIVTLILVRGLDWNKTLFTRLRALELTGGHPWPRAGKLLEIVAANPHLERLVFMEMDILPSRNNRGDMDSNVFRVPAPNLRYISFPMGCTPSLVIDFLSHLILQPTTAIRITSYARAGLNIARETDSLWGYIAERIQQLPDTCSVAIRAFGGVDLACPPTNPIIKVDFTWWYYSRSREQGLQDLVNKLGPLFQGERELRLIPLSWSPPQYRTPMAVGLWGRSLPQLTRLTVPNELWALELLATAQEDGGWSYPSMQRLGVLGGGWQPKLVELVENRRRDANVKTIETVVLEDVKVDQKDLDALRKVVNEVVVM